MYIITVLLKSSPQVFQFHFDQFKDAEKVIKHYLAKEMEFAGGIGIPLDIVDDYGSHGNIKSGEIAGIILTDIDREMAAQEVVEWAKISKDIKLQKKVQESPGAAILRAPNGLRA